MALGQRIICNSEESQPLTAVMTDLRALLTGTEACRTIVLSSTIDAASMNGARGREETKDCDGRTQGEKKISNWYFNNFVENE